MVNIASYNVRGLRDSVKRSKIFTFLRKKSHDVICIQESHSTKNIEKIWKSQWGGQVLFAHGDSNARGCLILIKRKLHTIVHKTYTDKEGRFLK